MVLILSKAFVCSGIKENLSSFLSLSKIQRHFLIIACFQIHIRTSFDKSLHNICSIHFRCYMQRSMHIVTIICIKSPIVVHKISFHEIIVIIILTKICIDISPFINKLLNKIYTYVRNSTYHCLKRAYTATRILPPINFLINIGSSIYHLNYFFLEQFLLCRFHRKIFVILPFYIYHYEQGDIIRRFCWFY